MKTIARALTLVAVLATLPAAAAQEQGQGKGPPHGKRPSRAEMEAKVKAACGTDFASLCPGAEGPHEKMECLRNNEASLSESCTAFVSDLKKHRPPHGHGGPGGPRGAGNFPPPPPPDDGGEGDGVAAAR